MLLINTIIEFLARWALISDDVEIRGLALAGASEIGILAVMGYNGFMLFHLN